MHPRTNAKSWTVASPMSFAAPWLRSCSTCSRSRWGAVPLSGQCQAPGIAGGGATLSRHRLGPMVPVRHRGGRADWRPLARRSPVGGRLGAPPHDGHGGRHGNRAVRAAPSAGGGDCVLVRTWHHCVEPAGTDPATVGAQTASAASPGYRGVTREPRSRASDQSGERTLDDAEGRQGGYDPRHS